MGERRKYVRYPAKRERRRREGRWENHKLGSRDDVMRLSRANQRPFRTYGRCTSRFVTFPSSLRSDDQSAVAPGFISHAISAAPCHAVGGKSEARLGRGVQGGVCNTKCGVRRTYEPSHCGISVPHKWGPPPASGLRARTHPLPRGPHALATADTHFLFTETCAKPAQRDMRAPPRTLHPVYAWFRRTRWGRPIFNRGPGELGEEE